MREKKPPHHEAALRPYCPLSIAECGGCSKTFRDKDRFIEADSFLDGLHMLMSLKRNLLSK